ncbi:MAG: hypothetical protein ABH817_00480 [archaeon]
MEDQNLTQRPAYTDASIAGMLDAKGDGTYTHVVGEVRAEVTEREISRRELNNVIVEK